MLADSPLIAFAATVAPDAAKAFYSGILGLKLTEESPYALAFDANGTMLRLQITGERKPAAHTALGWRVADIAAAIDGLTAQGVTFLRYEGMEQDERAVWQPSAGVKVAWFKDPDGNILSFSQWTG